MSEDNKKGNKYISKYIRDIITIAVIVACVAFIILNHSEIERVITKFIGLLTGFLYGIAIAYILTTPTNIIEKQLDKKKIKNSNLKAVVIVEILLFTLLIITIVAIVPQVVESVSKIINGLDNNINNIQNNIYRLADNNKFITNVIGKDKLSITKGINGILNSDAEKNINGILNNFLSNATRVGIQVTNIVIGLITNIFILFHRKELKYSIKNIVFAFWSDENANKIMERLRYINDIFSGFFVGKILDSIIVGIIAIVFTKILDIPYRILISIIISLTNIIPFIGPIIGAILSVIIVSGESMEKALVCLAFIIILQQVDGHIIGPRCISKTTGLSNFWVIFAIVMFGGLFGIAGMIIGVPAMAIILDTFNSIVRDKLITKNNFNKLVENNGENINGMQ